MAENRGGETGEIGLTEAELGGEDGLEAEGELVEALGETMEESGDARLCAVCRGGAGEALACSEELEAVGTGKAVKLGGEMLLDLVLGLGYQLGCGGRGGGAEVGGEVGDGEVSFMADGGDDGEIGGGDGAGYGLRVEGGQIFKRAAAAGDDDEVDEIRGIKLGDCRLDFRGGLVTLDGYGEDEDAETGVAAGDDIEEVADDCAGGRGDNADGTGKGG